MSEILWETNCGSHLWQMNTPESDIDYYLVFLSPSIDFLIGKGNIHSVHSIIGEDDKQSHELMIVVNELLKGNFNHIIGVFSPLVIRDWEELPELRRLGKLNLSKKCYNSIHGLATHNLKKFITNPTKEMKPLTPEAKQKKLNTIMRTLNFGINLLETGEMKFSPAWDTDEGNVENAIMELDESFANSKLPEEPEHVDEFIEWLLKIRLKSLDRRRDEDFMKLKQANEILEVKLLSERARADDLSVMMRHGM